MLKQYDIKTFHVTTFGCQMNLADSSTLVSALKARGYRRVKTQDLADLLIFNTCSVREKAEDRVLGRLGDLQALKQHRPQLRVAVVGCMAQRLGEKLKELAPQVDYVLGTDRVFDLPDLLENRNGSSSVMTAFGHEDMDAIESVKENDFAAFVTISRGCDNYCSYCIVPYVRGPERSHSVSHIVGTVQRLADEGVVEVTLLGQNVNSYRFEDSDFPKLLRTISRDTDIPRVRFMTSHPKDLSADLIEVLVTEPKVMPHVHLPLQAGSDRILMAMGRDYTLSHYLDIVGRMRERMEYLSLTTDLMVGFPSETESDYQATLDAVREIRYDAAFMFRYSVRPGTEAEKLDDDVPEGEKISRLDGLIALQKSIAAEVNQREIGRVRRCLVEGDSRRSLEYFRARTEGNKIVLFKKSDGVATGQVVPVKINSADAFTLHGELARDGK